jgi:hypothetical protein
MALSRSMLLPMVAVAVLCACSLHILVGSSADGSHHDQGSSAFLEVSQLHPSASTFSNQVRGSESVRLRASPGSGASSVSQAAFSWAGFAACLCCAAVAVHRGGRLQRRAGGGGYNQTAIIPSGTTVSTMTKEDEDAFLEKRCEGLRKLLPMSEQEFDDEVAEWGWIWARHLLPFAQEEDNQEAACVL